MSLKIYNSLTKKKEEFTPLEKGKVKMYVCGPTVYDEPHIGHLRSAYVFDVIRNYLEYSGYKVTFVRNVTDVDDKIIEKAKEGSNSNLKAAVENVSTACYQQYRKDLQKLGISEPYKEPFATKHIEDMKKIIEVLEQKGFAYESNGDYYFDVEKFQDYGKLSGQKKEEMLQSVRMDTNEKKRNPLDFALWKKAKEDEPAWSGPKGLGMGRPGWHIECSAMSMKYLGESFDIHGGGLDLVFPHHENEIAQSEAATGKPFVKYWIHHGLVTRDGHKMSKSLKNYVTLKKITDTYSDGISLLKLFFLGTHYSAPLDFSESKMKMEQSILKRFQEFFYNVEVKRKEGAVVNQESVDNFRQMFIERMNNDFNTPETITLMHELVSWTYKDWEPTQILDVAEVISEISRNVFGLSFSRPVLTSLSDEEISRYIGQRKQAKKDKNFKLADEIREKLLKEYQIELLDEADGVTRYRKKL